MLSNPRRASSTTATGTPGCAAAASRPATSTSAKLSDIFSAFFGDDLFGANGGGRARGGDVGRSRSRSSWRRRRRRRATFRFGVAVDVRALRRRRRRAGHDAGRAARPAAAPAASSRSRRASSASSSARRPCRAAAGQAGSSRPVRRAAPAPAGCSRSGRSTSRSRPASTTASGSGCAARATPASAAARAGDVYVSCASAATSGSSATATNLLDRRPDDDAGGARRDGHRADARRRASSSASSRVPSRARCACCAARGMPSSSGAGRGDHRVLVNVRVPRRLTASSAAARGFERSADDETYRRDEGSSTSSRAPSADTSSRRVSVAVRRAGQRRRARVMLELFPEGFEESTASDGRRARRVHGRAPARSGSGSLRRRRCADVADGWEERWRAFHRPVRVGSLWIGPPWRARRARRRRDRSGPAFGTGGAPHDAALPRAARPRAARQPAGRRLRVRRPRDRGGALGFGAGRSRSTSTRSRSRRPARTPRRTASRRRGPATRSRQPPGRDVVVANIAAREVLAGPRLARRRDHGGLSRLRATRGSPGYAARRAGRARGMGADLLEPRGGPRPMATFSARFLGCKVSYADAQAVRERLLATATRRRRRGRRRCGQHVLRHARGGSRSRASGVPRRPRARARLVTGCAANSPTMPSPGCPRTSSSSRGRARTRRAVAGDVGAIGCVQADARLDACARSSGSRTAAASRARSA